MTTAAESSPQQPVRYRRIFLKSAAHAWLAVLTLGVGFASAEPLGLLIGGVLYTLGHLYLPDTTWFRRRVDARRQAADQIAAQARAAAFEQPRAQIVAALSSDRRQRLDTLAAVCTDISAASSEAAAGELALSLDTRLRKLDELLWTYLRLLTIGQSLEIYLETERREQLPQTAEAAEAEVAALEADIAAAATATTRQDSAATSALDTRRKLLSSRRERLQALRQRLARVAQARANLELARSEQERLVEQAKLIRADAIANKNAGALGARIDLSIEHLAETNRWLAEMSDFKDLTTRLPPLPAGALLASAVRATPPPLPVRRQRKSTTQ
ncbi:MAG: hypothetical protein LBK99_11335 [Opitutaceae bacterium]|nr:hypothetical protein [Opitutaceae bacterium]